MFDSICCELQQFVTIDKALGLCLKMVELVVVDPTFSSLRTPNRGHFSLFEHIVQAV